MAYYNVVRDGNGWKVNKNGRRRFKKTYRTKAKALSAARRDADKGDSVQGQKLDGKWGNERTKGTFGPAGDR